jgi:hypothetical protein
MTDRSQTELAKLRGAALPDGLWERAQAGPRMAALPPRDPGHRGAGIAALIVVALAVAALWPLLARRDGIPPLGTETVAVPASGEVAPVFAPDGRPVFVVRDEDGTVRVVDGFSSHHPFGFDDLVGWCPATREFVEWAHGVHFDARGRWLEGPAPYGLVTYAFTVVTEDGAGAPVTIAIGDPLAPDPARSAARTEGNYTYCTDAAGAEVPLVGHTVDQSQVYASPADALAAAPDGYVAVRGTLLAPTDPPLGFNEEPWLRLCGEIAGGECVDGAVVINLDVVRFILEVLVESPGSAYEEPQVWFTRVDDGVLLGLAGMGPDGDAWTGPNAA